MNLYEHTIIARQDTGPAQLKQLQEKYSKIVEKNDGDIVKLENWGLMNLSYLIKKNKKGNYIHFKIKANGKTISELEKTENEIVHLIGKHQVNERQSNDFLPLFNENIRKFINENITISSIYELFPYSNPKYDPDKALIEIKESTNNLNTRLSNLKKINKSLIRFEENSSSLNWEELQKISAELEDDYKDN